MKYTTIVIDKNKLKNNYLKRLKLITIDDILLEEQAGIAYLELKEYLNKQKVEIVLKKGYIPIDKNEIDKDFYTGLALDIIIKKNQKEVDINLYKEIFSLFGFIILNNHLRYTTKVISKIIYENDYTLEDYKNKFSGVVVVNKPKGPTSFDIVNDISHIFGIKSVGHTGTLDPLATGVLVILIGKATKIAELLTADSKEYIATVKMGLKTDTLDITGNVVAEKEVDYNFNLEEEIKKWQKKYIQQIPLYSAVKVNGKKLYEYARENKEVKLPEKEVDIKEISLLNEEGDTFKFRCLVSKGCYIRSLINDIVTSINNIGVMSDLIRTKSGKFNVEEASLIEDIRENNYKLYSINQALDYKEIEIDSDLYKKISNGVPIKNTYNIKNKVLFIFKNKIVAIYEKKEEKLVSYRGFNF